jgi:hypothetical protein
MATITNESKVWRIEEKVKVMRKRKRKKEG